MVAIAIVKYLRRPHLRSRAFSRGAAENMQIAQRQERPELRLFVEVIQVTVRIWTGIPMELAVNKGFIVLAVCAGSMLGATPTWAGVSYAEYSGPDAVQTGNGGTKISKNGIDYWTSGLPYGRFQVLGVLSDTRTDKLLSGDAIGSKDLAKRVLKVGGNALIVLEQNSRFGGSNTVVNDYGFGAVASQNSFNKITTRFLVVRYLSMEPAAPSVERE